MYMVRKVIQKAIKGDTPKSPNMKVTKSMKNRPNRYIKLMQCR